jgi:UTP--glucose-1-phosphate uridylyltransferase
LKLNPMRAANGRGESIKIKLDPKFYGKFDQLEERLPGGVPSLVECDSLTVDGDVRFLERVTIRGSVTISSTRSQPAMIPAGTVVDNDLTL